MFLHILFILNKLSWLFLFKENINNLKKSYDKYVKFDAELDEYLTEINYRNKEIDALIEVEDTIETRAKKYKKTRKFLQKTVDKSSGIFKTRHDLVERFLFLFETKEAMLNKIGKTNEIIQEKKLELEALKNVIILKNINWGIRILKEELHLFCVILGRRARNFRTSK